MKMKIKGAFIIPLIAIMIAVFTLGVVPGAATDTTATETESSITETTEFDSLTYIPTTLPPTSSMEEEIEGFISDYLGEDIQQAEGPIRGFSELMESLLTSFRNILNSIMKIFQISGGMIGEGGALGNLGNLAGGLLG